MTGLYSLNLRMAGGRANVPIFSKETIFENGFLESVVPQNLTPYTAVIILAVITLVCKVLLDLYLKTRSGYLLRAVGDNETLVTSLAKDKGMVKIVGLAMDLRRWRAVSTASTKGFLRFLWEPVPWLSVLQMSSSEPSC